MSGLLTVSVKSPTDTLERPLRALDCSEQSLSQIGILVSISV